MGFPMGSVSFSQSFEIVILFSGRIVFLYVEHLLWIERIESLDSYAFKYSKLYYY